MIRFCPLELLKEETKGHVVVRARKDPTQPSELNIQEDYLPVLGSNPYFKEEIVEISDLSKL